MRKVHLVRHTSDGDGAGMAPSPPTARPLQTLCSQENGARPSGAHGLGERTPPPCPGASMRGPDAPWAAPPPSPRFPCPRGRAVPAPAPGPTHGRAVVHGVSTRDSHVSRFSLWQEDTCSSLRCGPARGTGPRRNAHTDADRGHTPGFTHTDAPTPGSAWTATADHVLRGDSSSGLTWAA